MVIAVTGLPRNGKTLSVVDMMIRTLRFTERMAVTTCQELKLDRLNAYLQEVDPDKVIDLDKRLKVLTKQEAFTFFRHRSGGLVLPPPPEMRGDRKIRAEEFVEEMRDYFLPLTTNPDWAVPCDYYITEAHDYFNADEWQQRGRAIQFYVSKHAHLHDNVIFETQWPGQLDNKFRKLVQENHDVVNRSLQRLGVFRRREGFSRYVYFKMKESETQKPLYVVDFKLDVAGVASCYHTTGALGLLHQGPEDSGAHKVRGLPWWSLWAGGVLACLGIFLVLYFGVKGMTKGLGHMVSAGSGEFTRATAENLGSGAKRAPVRAEPVAANAETPRQRRNVADGLPDSLPSSPILKQKDFRSVEVLGFVARGDRLNVLLSDGRVLTEGDGVLREVYRHKVVLNDGTELSFKRPASLSTGG